MFTFTQGESSAVSRPAEDGTEQGILSAGQMNDTGNARALIQAHGDRIRYVKGWGWVAWDGQRWERDAEGRVIEYAKQTLREMAQRAVTLTDSQERGQLLKHVSKSLDYPRLRNMVSAAESDPAIHGKTTDFDTDHYLFNAQNGTIDLRMGELRPHNPADKITRIAPVEYHADARSETWDRFIAWVCCHDGDLQDYLQRALGYTLTGLTGEKCFFVCYGPGGDNGKSTLLDAIRDVMGSDYAIAVAPATVTTKGGLSGDQTRENVALVGKRLVMTVEPDSSASLNSSRLKALTGGDTLPVKPLYAEAYDYRPELTLWMATNARLAVSESGNAMFSRIREIPFDNHIADADKDTDLPRKLQEAAPAILAWMVAGALKWQADRLNPPTRVTAAAQDYRADQDSFQAFLDACCEPDPDALVTIKDLLNSYRTWQANEPDAPLLTQKSLPTEAEQHGYKRGRAKGSNGTRGILGLRLKPATLPAYTPNLTTLDDDGDDF